MLNFNWLVYYQSQIFLPIILIYYRGNFVYNHWGRTINYRPLFYFTICTETLKRLEVKGLNKANFLVFSRRYSPLQKTCSPSHNLWTWNKLTQHTLHMEDFSSNEECDTNRSQTDNPAGQLHHHVTYRLEKLQQWLSLLTYV